MRIISVQFFIVFNEMVENHKINNAIWDYICLWINFKGADWRFCKWSIYFYIDIIRSFYFGGLLFTQLLADEVNSFLLNFSELISELLVTNWKWYDLCTTVNSQICWNFFLFPKCNST